MSSPEPRRRWLRRVLVAVAIILIALGGTVAFLLVHSPGNVSHPNLSFTSSSSTATPAPRRRKPVDRFLWARYGFDAPGNRYFAGSRGLGPPFRVGWRFQDYALLEFPPVIYQQHLFVMDDDGSVKELDKHTGRRLWERKVAMLAAASPAVGVRQQMVFVPVLSLHGHSPGGGAIVALYMRRGHVAWSRQVPAGTESSPLVSGNSLYFGDQSGTVYSLRARDGHVNWTYHASAAVKGSPALADGMLYFGDYSGRAYALNATTGRQVWAVSTNGAHFGFGSGNFYSSPAVAFGRVYMGNTDGRVYSFAERTGQLAWATATGAYVYASPAVQDVPGLGPTVYMGSYDGRFYAFNAQSGAVRWSHPSGGRISGSATIVGHTVYYSVLGLRRTIGLDTRTGRQVFAFPDGAFNPVVADYGAVYMSGYSMLYELLPRHGRGRSRHATHRSVRHRRHRRHRARRQPHRRHRAHRQPRHRHRHRHRHRRRAHRRRR